MAIFSPIQIVWVNKVHTFPNSNCLSKTIGSDYSLSS